MEYPSCLFHSHQTAGRMPAIELPDLILHLHHRRVGDITEYELAFRLRSIETEA
ncbi:MAG: hypothetical protein KME17_19405 [Cyanosarcina radialis HA8281-LM2]|nr:hypothetical protein [Cyanosarcina radialis HA8281-LM2]